jgi:hypothetical protein
MTQICDKCDRRFNDEYHSYTCPHRGIGFCAVCDCTICLCSAKTAGDWERSNNYRTVTVKVEGIE